MSGASPSPANAAVLSEEPVAGLFASSCLHRDRRRDRTVEEPPAVMIMRPELAARMPVPRRRYWTCGTCGLDLICLRPDDADPFIQRGEPLYGKRERRPLSAAEHRETVDALVSEWGWVCWLCREPLDPDLRHPDPEAVTLDHVLPLTDDGHDDIGNMALARSGCTRSRSDQRDARAWTVSVAESRERVHLRALVAPALRDAREDLDEAQRAQMVSSAGWAMQWAWRQAYRRAEPWPVPERVALRVARIVAQTWEPLGFVSGIPEGAAALAVHRHLEQHPEVGDVRLTVIAGSAYRACRLDPGTVQRAIPTGAAAAARGPRRDP